jgi:tungstate transport system ATP-binding protein
VTPLYELEGVRLARGGAFALDIPSLRIPEGGIHVLGGANGSGKSTLLSILAFLDRPDRGLVRFAGETAYPRLLGLSRFRREATLLHQSPRLFRGTVAENVAWGLRLRGIRGRDAAARVGEALESVGLSGFGPRDAAGLSGGETRRAALARAVAIRPRALLLDEPFSGLDREAAGAVSAAVAALSARGTTVLLAAPDAGEDARIGGSVLRMADGRIVGDADGGAAGCGRKEAGGCADAVV